ncbi:BTAD domain-containing putative transcriptional regulator [Streptomyces sp. NPDC004284]|uniref:AfsR/SARP family transcriptional regulator n=1 Tax=Streptomyces sp. NPDC004284 TaxID=3364695 RepID=UPI0036CD7995
MKEEHIPGTPVPSGLPGPARPVTLARRPLALTLLGPLDIRVHDSSALPRAAKQRQIFALLAVQGNRIVSTDTLIEELWDGRPPASARTALQTYIGQMRQNLADLRGVDRRTVATELLVTEENGYVLRFDPQDLDLHHFKSKLCAGTTLLNEGRPHEAHTLLRDALDLWHGRPMENVRTGSVLDAYAHHLEGLRLSAAEHLARVRIKLGAYHEAQTGLSELCAQYPLNEELQALRMTALCGCGRRDAALDSYLLFRQRILDTLGMDPSPRLVDLQRSILSGHRPLAAAAA